MKGCDLMAKHKDIDRASALLEGVQGWHIENAPYQRKTDRPDKRRCIFYDKISKTCTYNKKISKCNGSSNCITYREF